MKFKNKIMVISIFVAFFNLNSEAADNITYEFNNYLKSKLDITGYSNFAVDKFTEKYNLSQFLLNSQPQKIYGFIGFELERIKVKIDTAYKISPQKDKFYISGKTRVENNISIFTGELELIEIYDFKEKITSHELLIARFKAELKEKGTSKHTGKFIGDYYIILSKVAEEIRFAKAIPQFIQNHTFIGNWISNDNKLNFPVIWGENYMLEELQDFYYGLTNGNNIPDELIEKHWKTFNEAYISGIPKDIQENALKIENEEWWK